MGRNDEKTTSLKHTIMGCHTWFYKKANQPTLEEIKILLMKKNNREIDFAKRMQAGKINKDLLEAYPEWTPEYG